MFDKEIKFISHKEYVNLKDNLPVPIKLDLPKWFKELKHDVDHLTVKGCIPFLDSLTSGYLLKIPQDIRIAHNVENNEKKFDSIYKTGPLPHDLIKAMGLNLNEETPAYHKIFQLDGSPLVEKNKNLPFYKILNPWRIKTPKGYSCLFLPPLNNSDDRFSIISAIVDTDTFPQEINFPIVINGDKYPQLNTLIKKGTPYVQIIPFKRETWKMNIIGKKTEDFRDNKKIFYSLDMLHNYKNKYWSKKSWK
jgi:hypothetical protein